MLYEFFAVFISRKNIRAYFREARAWSHSFLCSQCIIRVRCGVMGIKTGIFEMIIKQLKSDIQQLNNNR